MKFRAQRIPPGLLDAYWPEIEQEISDACARSNGRYEPAHVRDFFARDVWQLWVAFDADGLAAVCATQIIRYPTGLRSFYIHIGAGRGLDFMADRMTEILEAAKDRECGLAEGQFRKGWRRVLPGWTHTHDVLERKL